MDVKALRKAQHMSQADFWARVGVTQSGGCRYEAGRPIPKPVRMLLDIAYGTERQARKAIGVLQGRKS